MREHRKTWTYWDVLLLLLTTFWAIFGVHAVLASLGAKFWAIAAWEVFQGKFLLYVLYGICFLRFFHLACGGMFPNRLWKKIVLAVILSAVFPILLSSYNSLLHWLDWTFYRTAYGETTVFLFPYYSMFIEDLTYFIGIGAIRYPGAALAMLLLCFSDIWLTGPKGAPLAARFKKTASDIFEKIMGSGISFQIEEYREQYREDLEKLLEKECESENGKADLELLLETLEDSNGKMFLAIRKGVLLGLVSGIVTCEPNDELAGCVTRIYDFETGATSEVYDALIARLEDYFREVGCAASTVTAGDHHESYARFFSRFGYTEKELVLGKDLGEKEYVPDLVVIDRNEPLRKRKKILSSEKKEK